MAKTAVVCCAGTANDFARGATDVVELLSALVQALACQVARRFPDEGAMEGVGAPASTGRKSAKLLGKMLGRGFEADVGGAYARGEIVRGGAAGSAARRPCATPRMPRVRSS